MKRDHPFDGHQKFGPLDDKITQKSIYQDKDDIYIKQAQKPELSFSLFTKALVYWHRRKKKQQQKNNRAYTDIAPVKEEDQVSLPLCCK